MNLHLHPASLLGLGEGPLTSPKALVDLNPMLGKRRTGSRRFWSYPEQAILREHYPTGGIAACLPLLAGRSACAIQGQVKALGLSRLTAAGERKPRTVYRSSAAIDRAITEVYQGRPTRGQVKALCLTLNRPRHWISVRAAALGLALPRFKQPDWTAPEDDVLRQWGESRDAVAVARILRKHGFRRSPSAVAQRLKHLRIFREAPDDLYSAVTLAAALGCSRAAVVRWIEKGWLLARRKPAGHASLGGSAQDRAWQISRRHARMFVIDNVGLIDFRRVDKVWLVDLLAGPQGGGAS